MTTLTSFPGGRPGRRAWAPKPPTFPRTTLPGWAGGKTLSSNPRSMHLSNLHRHAGDIVAADLLQPRVAGWAGHSL
jgi:hypothetical protein